MFPKFPQSSLGIPRVPQLPPPLEHPPLKNLTTIRRTKMSVPNSNQLNNGEIFHSPFWTKARYGNGECLCTGWCCDGAADEHSHLEPLGMGILSDFFFSRYHKVGPEILLFPPQKGGSKPKCFFLGKNQKSLPYLGGLFHLGSKVGSGAHLARWKYVWSTYPLYEDAGSSPPGWRITLPKFNIAAEISHPKRKVIF